MKEQYRRTNDLKKAKNNNTRFMAMRMKRNMKDLPGEFAEAIPRYA